MKREIEILLNAGGVSAARENAKTDSGKLPTWLSDSALAEVREFHGGLIDPEIPDGEGDEEIGFGRTPLVSLPALAEKLGVRAIYIKDESKRFGLNAFKGLGASYAVGRAAEDYYARMGDQYLLMMEQTGGNESAVKSMSMGAPFNMGPPVFVTATDGNHGRAVAWAASKVPGAKARVFMPKGSAEVRAAAIRSHGDTRCEITDMSYDDAVRHAASYAKRNGYILVQDTAFDGYTDIPRQITQGYTTMATEALAQIREQQAAERSEAAGSDKTIGGGDKAAAGTTSWPTHVFLQAGVGSMAGGVLGFLANRFKEKLPVVTIMEPSDVACVYESALNGKPTAVPEPNFNLNEEVSKDATANNGTAKDSTANNGAAKDGNSNNVETITEMAGLNCGEVNIETWPILRDFATAYAKCPDWVTELGIRTLANPLGEDHPVVSGESGAVGAGLLTALMSMPEYGGLAQKLGLGPDSVVLLFSTEGATDPDNYKRILQG